MLDPMRIVDLAMTMVLRMAAAMDVAQVVWWVDETDQRKVNDLDDK